MNKQDIQNLLSEIAGGRLSIEDGLKQLAHMPFIEIDCARLDGHRPLRNGLSEVIYGASKSMDQIRKIVAALTEKGLNVFGTRVDRTKGDALEKEFKGLRYDAVSSTFQLIQKPITPLEGNIAICCAGTADIPVADEAYRTSTFFGAEAKRYYDIGVAGLHRLIDKTEEIKSADVIIVVAGMEGALPSVAGGMFSQPIIAVPTSVGYGVNFSGLTALMSMLCSCAEGISVVNVDNGFGAACCAVRILNQRGYANKK